MHLFAEISRLLQPFVQIDNLSNIVLINPYCMMIKTSRISLTKYSISPNFSEVIRGQVLLYTHMHTCMCVYKYT